MTGRNALRVAVVAAVLAVLAVEGVAIAPRLEQTSDALSHPHWRWLVIAVLAELWSMVAFARIQRRMIAVGGLRLPMCRAVALTFAANAMSVTLPAGPVVSSAYTFRRMRAWGASASSITWAMVTSGVLSTVALTVIGVFGAGLVGGHENYPEIALEVALVVAGGLAVRWLVHRPELLTRAGVSGVAAVNRLRRRPRDLGADGVRQMVSDLLALRPTSLDWGLGLTYALLNWIMDLICLIAACRAVGASGPTIAAATVAYAAGMAASSVPLVPGGLGLVDGALLVALVHGGLSLPQATAGIVVYRLISFALVAAIGWVFWVLLNRRPAAVDATTGALGAAEVIVVVGPAESGAPGVTEAALGRLP